MNGERARAPGHHATPQGLRRHRAASARLASALALLIAAAAAPSSALAQEGPRARARVPDLLARLDHEDWRERERAQQGLIALGEPGLEALRDAADSGSPEIAHRARHILDRLDPLRVRVRLVRLALDEPVRVIEISDAEGVVGEELRLAPSDAAADAPIHYATAVSTPTGGIEVAAEKAFSTTGYRTPLGSLAGAPGAVSILERGADSFYLQLGAHLERRRHPWITILIHEHRRRSALLRDVASKETVGGSVFTARGDAFLPAVVERLLAQLDDRDARLRRAAADTLGLLDAREAITPLRRLRDDASCRSSADHALARLGDPEALARLEQLLAHGDDADASPATPEPDATLPANPAESLELATRRADHRLTEAALVLAPTGAPAALNHLVSKLGSADPNVTHEILATLADSMDGVRRHPQIVRTLLEKAAEKDTIAQLPWTDVESEHFYRRVCETFDPDSADARSLAERLLGTFAATVGQEDTGRQLVVDVFRQLWGLLDRRFGGSLSREPLVDLLVRLRDQTTLAGTCAWTAAYLDPLDSASFDAIAGSIAARLQDREPGEESAAIGLLVGVASEFRLSAEQTVRVVELIARALDGAQQSYYDEMLAALEELTGLSAPDDPRQRASSASTVARAASARQRLLALRPRVAEWLGSPEVRAAALRTRDAAETEAGVESSEPLLELIEIDLLERPESAEAIPHEDPGAPRTELLDARVLRVPLGTPVEFTDRFGNRRTVTVAAGTTTRATTVSRTVTSFERFRMTNGRRQTVMLTEDVPELRSGRVGAGVRSGWYVSSDSQLSPYRIWANSSPSLQTLLLVRRLSPDDGRPDSMFPASLDERAAVWTLFVDRLKEAIPRLRTDYRFRVAMNVVRRLDVRDVVPTLREVFDSAPDATLAGELLALGDDGGLEFLHAQVRGEDVNAQMQAAQILTEHGDREGLRHLLAAIQDGGTRTSTSMVLRSLDVFLQSSNPTAEERRTVLDAIIARLHVSAFQSMAFSILRREAGTDFGYLDSLRLRDFQEKRQALEIAIERAREWWARSPLSEGR